MFMTLILRLFIFLFSRNVAQVGDNKVITYGLGFCECRSPKGVRHAMHMFYELVSGKRNWFVWFMNNVVFQIPELVGTFRCQC